jgi:hypothetical protein
MGFYGNYYKINANLDSGLTTKENGQETTISLVEDVKNVLGISAENGVIKVGLASRLKAIEDELGMLIPEGEYGGEAFS